MVLTVTFLIVNYDCVGDRQRHTRLGVGGYGLRDRLSLYRTRLGMYGLGEPRVPRGWGAPLASNRPVGQREGVSLVGFCVEG